MTKTKPRTEVTWDLDLDAAMRRMIAPYELTDLADPTKRASMKTKLSTTTRGYYDGGVDGQSRRWTRKGIEHRVWLRLREDGRPASLTIKGGYYTDDRWHLYTWSDILDRIALMPTEQMAALVTANAVYLRSMADFPVWHAKGAAIGCGRIPHDVPREDLPPGQRLYLEQHDAYTVIRDTWEDEREVIGTARDAAHDACYSTPLFAPVPDDAVFEWVGE